MSIVYIGEVSMEQNSCSPQERSISNSWCCLLKSPLFQAELIVMKAE